MVVPAQNCANCALLAEKIKRLEQEVERLTKQKTLHQTQPDQEAQNFTHQLDELSFLAPRGRFLPLFNDKRDIFLKGKNASLLLSQQNVAYAHLLPDPREANALFLCIGFNTPVICGKSTIASITLKSKSNELFKHRTIQGDTEQWGDWLESISPSTHLFQMIRQFWNPGRTVDSSKIFSSFACYHKASEVAAYILPGEILVRDAGKCPSIFPHSKTRAEILPPSGRRTFDIQLEASSEGGGKPLKMELTLIAADLYSSIYEDLKKYGCTVNGDCYINGDEIEEKATNDYDGESGSSDDSDEEGDSDFAPDDDSEPEEEYDEHGGIQVEEQDGDYGSRGDGPAGDSESDGEVSDTSAEHGEAVEDEYKRQRVD